MRIYFVRHGETAHNASRIHQPLDVPLSEKGRKQAEFVAKRLTDIDFEIIVSSDLLRAKETAEIIKQKTRKEIVFTKLAHERLQPSIFHNKSIDDPSLTEAKAMMEKNVRDPNFRYADEENFHDLKVRSSKLLDFLESRPEQNLVVVLHGTILRYLLATMMFGKDYDWDTFIDWAMFAFLHNTGLTVCEQYEGRWKLMTWNDSAHLGEVDD